MIPRKQASPRASFGEEPAIPGLPLTAGPVSTGPALSGMTKAELAALQPATEAILFLQNVTGIVAVDLARDATGELVGVVARGKRNLLIELRFQE